MKFVLDASVAIAWELYEATSSNALWLRDEARLGQHYFVAPDVFPIECAHALTRAERRNLIPQEQAHTLLIQILHNRVQTVSSNTLLVRAVELSSQTRVGVYDCL